MQNGQKYFQSILLSIFWVGVGVQIPLFAAVKHVEN